MRLIFRSFEELEYPNTPEPDAQKHVRQGGGTCPRCGSDEIEASSLTEVDSGAAVRGVQCNRCSSGWTESFTLTGMEGDQRDDRVIIPFELKDANPEYDTRLKGLVTIYPGHGIEFIFDGYGDHGTQPGHGTPVYIDIYQEELRVCIWKDINVEDPEIISLEKARESMRSN